VTVEQQLPTSGDVSGERQLSANQEFFCAFDRGNDLGAFGPRHLVAYTWRLRGPVDVDTLQLALDDVVLRHEGLRTEIIRAEGNNHALVHPPSSVELAVTDLSAATDEAARQHRANEFFNEAESGTCSLTEMPLLRARLGRFDDNDWVLALVTHHTVSDGWSMHLIMRDVATFYATRRGLDAPELPPMRQQGEHAAWQQQELAGSATDRAREYWKGKLAGGKITTLPPDRTRRLEVPPVYGVHRFLFDEQITAATKEFAKATRSSPFMVLYACFYLFLHRRTGITDLAAPTLTSGREEPDFRETVGPFFNFMPIRTDIADCETFRDLANKTRASLLEAMSYEIPFREIAGQAEPGLMEPFMDPNGVVTAFEVFQTPQTLVDTLIGDVRYTGVRRNTVSAVDTSEIPDGNLWDFNLDPAGDMVGIVKYNSLDFDESSIVAMVEEYRELLSASLAAPDSPLIR
jgi:condensation enzyme